MNFTDKIKKEILSKPIKETHCKKAFIAGLIRGSGVLYEKDGELGVEFKVFDEQTLVTLTTTFYDLFDYEIREVSVSEGQNSKSKLYLSLSGEKAVEILTELGILITDEEGVGVDLTFFNDITKKECCLKAFIRGLFVATGRCTLPNENDNSSTSYHLEISFSHHSPALETSSKLAEYGIMTKIVKRREGYIIYIKSAEEIKDFLAFLPAPISVLKITDLMINRELANKINRQKNCDLGNVTKQVEASRKQILAIKKIKETIGLDTLSKDLETTARTRIEYPDDTLLELAERLDVSKSCLNHRLRKIMTIANEL
ncbi:MAG: DNA-binding protein WhiA [Clostridiales bacterium]|nr:DNA-binding protein WhiA [Clostridiales bacterium]